MKRVYEFYAYKLAEALSDMVWHGFDKWNKKLQNTRGYQIIRSSTALQKHEGQISNFYFQRSVNGYNNLKCSILSRVRDIPAINQVETIGKRPLLPNSGVRLKF